MKIIEIGGRCDGNIYINLDYIESISIEGVTHVVRMCSGEEYHIGSLALDGFMEALEKYQKDQSVVTIKTK